MQRKRDVILKNLIQIHETESTKSDTRGPGASAQVLPIGISFSM